MNVIRFSLSPLSLAVAAVLAWPAGSTAQEPPTSERIADAIEDELGFDHVVPAHSIDVRIENGVATLSGDVDNILVRERAAHIARTVRGVGSVVNDITVVFPDIEASQLRADVESALANDPATDAHEIDVSATDAGVARLSGSVQSWAERDLCERVAMAVRGITSIENAIAVDYRKTRMDSEIARDIEQSLRWNRLVDASRIRVEVEDGEVTLTGLVASAAERYRAKAEAFVAGVKTVSIEQLRVGSGEQTIGASAREYVLSSDNDVRRAVETALRRNPRVAAFKIDTSVDDGRVTLRGTVDNLLARRSAERSARITAGVSGVTNRIKVRDSSGRTSDAVARAVRAALQRDPFVDRFDVTVVVREGSAHLYGVVDTAFERAQAEQVASRVTGVVHVENYMRASSKELTTYDPFVDPWPIHLYPWYRYTPSKSFLSDARIREQIDEQLWWSPFVDRGGFDIAVEDGIATLRGTVQSESEREAAIENAYEAGACWVVDELKVAPAAERTRR